MKNVLVAGACGGMGRAVCKRLQECGYAVWGIDCTPACENESVHYVQADVTDLAALQQAYMLISRQVESLYAIVYMAGIYRMASLLEISEAELLRSFDVNVFGMYRVNKVFRPLLQRGSRFILTSSELAPLDPLPFNGLYSVTKSTVEKYAYSLRMEVKLHGIEVCVLRPGAVQTGLLGESMTQLDAFCENTELYRETSKRFKKLVTSVEAKAVLPEKVAGLVMKALKRRHPRYVYNLNRNPLLRLLNILPRHLQVAIIGRLLKDKS